MRIGTVVHDFANSSKTNKIVFLKKKLFNFFRRFQLQKKKLMNAEAKIKERCQNLIKIMLFFQLNSLKNYHRIHLSPTSYSC